MRPNIDPVEFGKAMGAIVREAIAPLARRVAELELLIKGDSAAQIDEITKAMLGEEDLDG